MIARSKRGELETLEISNSVAHATIALQGAHLLEYGHHGESPLFFLSDSARYEKGHAIRGGVPVCWPWFGDRRNRDGSIDRNSPKHGFARTALWHCKEMREAEDATIVVMALSDREASHKVWDHPFELELEIHIGQELSMQLTTYNHGSEDFTISEALHSYFLVSDIERVKVEGLANRPYYNKVDDSYDNVEDEILHFSGETDRVYQGINHPVHIIDDQRTISIFNSGASTVVVWNPWKSLAESMDDLSGYQTMLCVESANAMERFITVTPGNSHSFKTVYRIE